MKESKYLIVMVVLCCFLALFGCSSKKSIVGAWSYSTNSGNKHTMMFYKDGTCLDTPVDWHSNHAETYKIQEDGVLIFKTTYGDTVTYELTESKEEALESYEHYYLSGNTLILCTIEFTRE